VNAKKRAAMSLWSSWKLWGRRVTGVLLVFFLVTDAQPHKGSQLRWLSQSFWRMRCRSTQNCNILIIILLIGLPYVYPLPSIKGLLSHPVGPLARSASSYLPVRFHRSFSSPHVAADPRGRGENLGTWDLRYWALA
jgi:hypothetical protein